MSFITPEELKQLVNTAERRPEPIWKLSHLAATRIFGALPSADAFRLGFFISEAEDWIETIGENSKQKIRLAARIRESANHYYAGSMLFHRKAIETANQIQDFTTTNSVHTRMWCGLLKDAVERRLERQGDHAETKKRKVGEIMDNLHHDRTANEINLEKKAKVCSFQDPLDREARLPEDKLLTPPRLPRLTMGPTWDKEAEETEIDEEEEEEDSDEDTEDDSEEEEDSDEEDSDEDTDDDLEVWEPSAPAYRTPIKEEILP